MHIGYSLHREFEPEIYIKVLISIAKADKNNDLPEYLFVKQQAKMLGVDFDEVWNETDPTFSFRSVKISRYTSLVIIRDCLHLASLDNNLTVFERSKIYEYAEKLDVKRSDVDHIEKWLVEYDILNSKWNELVKE